MPRALLYARYSTDRQSDASAEDQLRLCRQRADREGWEIAEEFKDLAISGTVRDRPGLNDLMRAIERGAGTIVLAESLDRLSRDQEDIAGFFKRARHYGARIVTLSEGEIGAIHIGMNGTMAAVQLEQLGEKVRRGQIGRVVAGKIPGGISYGYAPVREFREDGTFEKGVRKVRDDQAEIVRRIYRQYVDGVGAVEIARQLNAEGQRAPRGGLWRASTILGHRARRNGILNNEMYIGRLLYMRQRFPKDPDSRKRVSRANDESQWISTDVPHLRIVDDATWQAAQARLRGGSDDFGHGGNRHEPWKARRPRKLLSGLMRCGACGGTVTILGGERWGCSNAKQTGTCNNTRTISNRIVERRVWAAMNDEMLNPETVAAYVEEFRKTAMEERRRRQRDRAGSAARLAQIDRELERIADAIAAGMPIDKLKARAVALDAERQTLIARNDEASSIEELMLHPGLAEAYRARVVNIRALMDGPEEGRRAARNEFRSMIEAVVCSPNPEGLGMVLEIHGELANILSIAQSRPVRSGFDVTAKLVAGAGFGRRSKVAVVPA